MSVDSEVKLIAGAVAAAAVAPLEAAAAALKANLVSVAESASVLTDAVTVIAGRVKALEAAVAALENAAPSPPPVVTPPPPVVSGVPQIPAADAKTLLRWSGADGVLAPWKKLKYPDDPPHVAPGQLAGNCVPGQEMTRWCRYTKALTDPTLISVHDGYLDLNCRARNDGSNFWDGAFVGTGLPAPTSFTFTAPALVEWWARFSLGTAGWPTLWTLDGVNWSSNELDWPEAYAGRLNANVHPGNGHAQLAAPADCATTFHRYGLLWTPTALTFYLDGNQVASVAQAIGGSMALLADAKVGLATPTAATPNPSFMHVAGVRVQRP